MRKRILCLAALVLCSSASAFAAEGFVVGDVELRAGPDPAYPSITWLRDGTPVSIMGCVGNWSWCDVATPSDRGWVPADFLQEIYQGQRVYVPEYGVIIGVPIVTFEFTTYWDRHYRSRPFYVQRDRFVSVQPQLAPPRHAPRTAPAVTGSAPAANAPINVAPQQQRAPAPAPATTQQPAATNPTRDAHPQMERRPAPETRTTTAAPVTRESAPRPAPAPVEHRPPSQDQNAPAPAEHRAPPQRQNVPAPAEHRAPPQDQHAPASAEQQKPAPKEQAKPAQKDKKDQQEKKEQ